MLAITPQPMSNAKKENIGKKRGVTQIFVKHTPKHLSLQTTNDTEQEVTPLLYFNIKFHL